MITAVIIAIVFGALSGVLWSVMDNGIQRLTAGFIEETQLTSIIRMVVAGFLGQNLAALAVALVFHTVPGGGLLSLVSIVLSILVYIRTRDGFSRGY